MAALRQQRQSTTRHLRSSADVREGSHQHDKISLVLIPQIVDGLVPPEVGEFNTVVFALYDVWKLRQGGKGIRVKGRDQRGYTR